MTHTSAMTRVRAGAARDWRLWLALATVYLVWGSTYLALRVMVRTIPPLLGSGARFLAAGAVLYPFLVARRGWAGVRVTTREAGAATLVGVLFLAGGTGLVTVAERDVPSGLAAVLVAAMPLFVVVLRYLVSEPVPRATSVGVVAGLAGVAVLLLPGNPAPEAGFIGLGLILVADLSMAVASFASSRLPVPRDTLVATAYELLAAGLVLCAAGLLTGEAAGLQAERFSGESLAALAYLIVAGSLVAYTAYVWLLANAPVSKATTHTHVNPVVAVALGWLVLDERVTLATLAGAALVVGSVAAVVRHESAAEPERETVP
ncbi:MAG TPA: EamA family transporter [Actinomycetota bacterium]|nr:EamA family transporter [Actinomycetota bacterium]